ncbi:MAG: restriction endonuclease subunit S [Promethearchaeia archaeon]
MTLKSITVNFEEIKKHPTNRIDSKYFFIKKAFEKFKQKGFTVVNLDSLKKYIISGSYIDTYLNENDSNAIPYIRVSTVKHYFLNENKEDFAFVSKDVPEKIKTKKNDIVIGRTAVLGIASIIDDNSEGFAISQHVTRIKFNEEKISPEYALAYMNSKLFKLQMAIASYGTTRTELTHRQIKNVKFILPPEEIEEKIKILIRESIFKNRKSLKLIHQAQKFFYQKLEIDFSNLKKENVFSVNLSDFKDTDLWTPKNNYPFYINTIKAIKQKWQTVHIRDIATIEKGNEVGSKNYNSYLDKKDSDIPFIRTSDLVNYEVDLFPDYYVPKEIYEEINQDIKEGDILFTKDGRIGIIAMVTKTDKIIIASGLIRLRLKDQAKEYNLTPEYLFLVLSLKEIGLFPALRRTVVASTIPHLRIERIKEIEIPILDENSIAEITKIIKEAFILKDEKKKLIQKVEEEINNFFKI